MAPAGRQRPRPARRIPPGTDRRLGQLNAATSSSDPWRPSLEPGLRRYLRRTGGGLLRVDAAAVKRESHLDASGCLCTFDVTLTPEDLTAAYEQLLAVGRCWRDMKGVLGLRPVFHHREDRIRARVQLCWLALLLIRVVENVRGDTWRNVRHELDRMCPVPVATADG